jgi:hypothetical protein
MYQSRNWAEILWAKDTFTEGVGSFGRFDAEYFEFQL